MSKPGDSSPIKPNPSRNNPVYYSVWNDGMVGNPGETAIKDYEGAFGTFGKQKKMNVLGDLSYAFFNNAHPGADAKLFAHGACSSTQHRRKSRMLQLWQREITETTKFLLGMNGPERLMV